MALAQRSERSVVSRSRTHAQVGPRPMVRVTAGVRVAPQPQLTVVPRRRRAARLVTFGAMFIFSVMLGAAAFQTQLAPRQVTIDQLDRQVEEARDTYDALRRQRTELRSPGRLEQAATNLGMVPGRKTEFLELSPEVIAVVQQYAGPPSEVQQAPAGQLDQFNEVKALEGGQP